MPRKSPLRATMFRMIMLLQLAAPQHLSSSEPSAINTKNRNKTETTDNYETNKAEKRKQLSTQRNQTKPREKTGQDKTRKTAEQDKTEEGPRTREDKPKPNLADRGTWKFSRVVSFYSVAESTCVIILIRFAGPVLMNPVLLELSLQQDLDRDLKLAHDGRRKSGRKSARASTRSSTLQSSWPQVINEDSCSLRRADRTVNIP